MRLFDTYTKSLVELPAAPGPVRMYFCGPTVYARAHVGNARPFVLGMWLRSWLRLGGYHATLVHNMPDVNDHIYPPAPGHRGRPGWQIECWVMAEELLGESFEIHGGGLDLVFPHHENELAQSRALGHPFAQVWAHNGMLRFTGEKMSKSLGNIATLRETLDEWGRETTLVFFLGGHWRKPIDFSPETMAQAAAQAESFRNVFRAPSEDGGDWEAFAAALEDDFNTPEALALMHQWRDHELLHR